MVVVRTAFVISQICWAMDNRGRKSKLPTSGVSVYPVDGVEFIRVLKTFRKLLLSCIGPWGGLKMVVSSVGSVTTTSSSKRLFHSLNFCNPLLLLIINIVDSQLQTSGDCGLYTGALSALFLEHFLTVRNISKALIVDVIGILSSFCTDILTSDDCRIRIPVEIGDLSQMLTLTRNVLRSKTGCSMQTEAVDHVCLQIVRAFIQSIPDVRGGCTLGEVCMSVVEGPGVESSEMFQGILYAVPDVPAEQEWKWKVKHVQDGHHKGHVCLVLFNISLSDLHDESRDTPLQFECGSIVRHKNFIVEQVKLLIGDLIQAGVAIFACQKVVHPMIKEHLRRNGILVLERLGRDQARALAALSGACPVSCVTASMNASHLGYLQQITHVVRHQKSYLLLENSRSNVATLMLCNWNEESVEELKVVCGQALQALRSLLWEPHALPGGGCLETWLAVHILRRAEEESVEVLRTVGCSLSQLQQVAWQVSRCLLDMACSTHKMRRVLLFDTAMFHLWCSVAESATSWQEQVDDTCSCGLVNKSSIVGSGGQWVDIREWLLAPQGWETVSQIQRRPGGGLKFPTTSSDIVVVDCFMGKLNALKMTFECCSHVLNVGMFVCNQGN